MEQNEKILIMTNEEKAQEIATKICGYTPSNDNWDITGEYGCAEDSAFEMAEWKDKQFKEYLERKKSEYGIDYSVNALELLNEIINEFLRRTEI